MKTRAELFAYYAESLAASAILWIAAVSFLMLNAEAPLPGVFWILGMTLAAATVYILVLRRGITVASLAVVSAFLLAGEITALILLYTGSVTFGYVMTCILMAGVSVYVPMYLSMKKQLLAKHMTFIDVTIGAFVWLMVFYTSISPDTFSILCIIAVTVMNVAAAIGLRMSEEGMEEGIGRAFALAAGASAAAAGVVFLLVKLFSGSGSVTEAVFRGIRNFFLKIGSLIERFIGWLASLMPEPEPEAAAEAAPAGGMAVGEVDMTEVAVNPVIPAVVIGAVILIIVILILRKSARTRISLSAGLKMQQSGVRIRRKKRNHFSRWKKFFEEIKFRIRSVLERNTSPGVLVWLERKALKRKIPRERGESIREFTLRLAPEGELIPLTEDLEGKLYGGRNYTLSTKDCRMVRKEMKKLFRVRK